MLRSSITPDACPVCAEPVECATGLLHDSRPRPDDFSLCWGCGALLRFNDDLTLRACESAEAHAELGTPERVAIFAAQKRIRERGPLAGRRGRT